DLAGDAVRTADPMSAPTYANRTLYADVPLALGIRELMRADHVRARSLVRDRIHRVVDYSAKLGRRRDVGDGADLFTVLPTTPTIQTRHFEIRLTHSDHGC